MDTHGRAVAAKRVGYPHGSGFDHFALGFVDCQPGDLLGFAAGVSLSADDMAFERQADHAQAHVLVHAGEPFGVYLDSGFFEHFTRNAVCGGFVEFQHAAATKQTVTGKPQVTVFAPGFS